MGARDQRLLVARRPLAEVVEVGSEAPQVIEILVPLRLGLACSCLELLELPLKLGDTRHEVGLCLRVLGHSFRASSSTTSYSASSTTSSSVSVSPAAPLPVVPDACCDCTRS